MRCSPLLTMKDMTMARIYTRDGDEGSSGLANGERRDKTDLRFAVIGSIDEANAQLGLLLCEDLDSNAQAHLGAIQHQLFDLGSDIACPDDLEKIPRLGPEHVQDIERIIDAYQNEMDPLSQFIIPGGTRAASLCHVIRCIIRRAEREAWALHAEEPINVYALHYLNRLSDLFFVCARRSNDNGSDDVYWQANVMLDS